MTDAGGATNVVVHIDDLTVDYPAHRASRAHRVIDGLTFSIAAGEVVGLIGETGSGKSTLARVLSGDLVTARGADPAPVISGGEVTVAGYSLRGIHRRSLAKLSFRVAYLPQDAGQRLPPELTVSETIAAPVLERDKRYNRAALGLRAAELLDAVQLPLALLDKYPYELSSGQRQRVAIAKSLVLAPKVLIADEPTSGIDATVRGAVTELLQGLQREQGLTAVVISHDVSLLRATTHRVMALHHGQLAGVGTIDELLSEPRHPFLVGFSRAVAKGHRSAPGQPGL